MALSSLEVVEGVFICRFRNQNGLMVRHWLVTSTTGTSADVSQVAQRLYVVFGPIINDLQPATVSMLGCSARVIVGVKTDKGYSSDAATTGTVGGECMGTQLSGLLSLRTGLAGRSKRGRMYVPFPSENDNTADAKPSDDYTDRLHTLGNAIKANVTVTASVGNTAVLAPVIYSRKLNTSYPISDTLKRGEWATQRRRSQINSGDVVIIP